jgi:hypothetical protein
MDLPESLAPLKPLLGGLLLPLVVSLIALVLAGAPRLLLPLAIGGGYLAGHTAVLGLPPWPPLERVDYLWYLTPLVLALGLVEALVRLPAVPRWGLRTLLWATVLVLLVLPQLKNDWQGSARVAWLAGLGAAGLVFWAALVPLAERLPRAELPLLLVALALGSGLVLFWSGSLSYAQLAGALGAAVGAAVLAAWWLPAPLARGAGSVAAVLFLALWLLGYFSAEMPASCAVLLLLSVPLAWLTQLPPLRQRLRPWQAILLRAVLVLLPIGGAVVLAWRAAPPPDPYQQLGT